MTLQGFKHTYHNITQNLTGHVKSMCYAFFERNRNSQKLHDLAGCLCCFGNSPIPSQFIEMIFPEYENEITIMIDLGIAKYLANDYIQMLPLFSYAMFKTEHPMYKQENIIKATEKVKLFLKEYEQTLSIPYLSDTLLSFTQAIYNKVASKNNVRQTKTAKEFENRQNIMYLVYHYYLDAGDYTIAEKVAASIHFPELKGNHSPIDAGLFHINCSMRQGHPIEKKANEIEAAIISNSQATEMIDIPLTVTAMLDDLINQYCINFFNLFFENTPALQKQQTAIVHYIKKYIYIITEKQHNALMSMTEEKLAYYKICSEFIEKPEPDNKYFLSSFRSVQYWKNADCRLSGTAFSLFMYSFYAYFRITYFRSEAKNSTITIKNELLLQTREMQGQIRACAMIPKRTFLLCLYAHISVAMLQCCIYLLDDSFAKEMPIFTNPEITKELFSRSAMTKEELEDALLLLERMPQT